MKRSPSRLYRSFAHVHLARSWVPLVEQLSYDASMFAGIISGALMFHSSPPAFVDDQGYQL